MNFEFLSKLLDVSARISIAICLACGFLLFFPLKYLPTGFDAFRNQHGIWLFVVFAISSSIMISYLLKWIKDIIVDKWMTKKVWDNYKTILENLSDSEKKFIKYYYDKRETSLLLDLGNPIIKRLETFNIISQSASTIVAHIDEIPGFFQPWVFKLIDKNPNYLDV